MAVDKNLIEQLTLLTPQQKMEVVRLLTQDENKKKRNLIELAGLGAEIWKDIDVDEYIRKERENWD